MRFDWALLSTAEGLATIGTMSINSTRPTFACIQPPSMMKTVERQLARVLQVPYSSIKFLILMLSPQASPSGERIEVLKFAV